MSELQAQCPKCKSTLEIDEGFIETNLNCPVCSALLHFTKDGRLITKEKSVKVVSISKNQFQKKVSSKPKEEEASPELMEKFKLFVILGLLISAIGIGTGAYYLVKGDKINTENSQIRSQNNDVLFNEEYNNKIVLEEGEQLSIIMDKSLYSILDELRVMGRLKANQVETRRKIDEIFSKGKICKSDIKTELNKLPTGVYYLISRNDDQYAVDKISKSVGQKNGFNTTVSLIKFTFNDLKPLY